MGLIISYQYQDVRFMIFLCSLVMIIKIEVVLYKIVFVVLLYLHIISKFVRISILKFSRMHSKEIVIWKKKKKLFFVEYQFYTLLRKKLNFWNDVCRLSTQYDGAEKDGPNIDHIWFLFSNPDLTIYWNDWIIYMYKYRAKRHTKRIGYHLPNNTDTRLIHQQIQKNQDLRL